MSHPYRETSTTNLSDDNELLSYLEAHSETELALVHRDHLTRLFELAGCEPPVNLAAREFWEAHAPSVKPLVRLARERMRAQHEGRG